MDIVSTIHENLSFLTKSQKVVAEKILENPMAIAFSSIEQFSKQAHVSTATIIRFANTLGLSGYTDLQEQLRQYCYSQFFPVSRLEKNRNLQKDTESILDHIYNMQLDNLRLTYTQELEQKLIATVQYLKNAPHIYTLAPRGSFAITYYLEHHLNRILRNTTALPDNSRIVDALMGICEGDVLIVCNMPRYNRRIYRAAQIAKDRGATIISIMDSIVSPYSNISNVLLPATCYSSDFHNSLLSAMLIAEMIITLLISDDMINVSLKLQEMEPLFKDLDTFM